MILHSVLEFQKILNGFLRLIRRGNNEEELEKELFLNEQYKILCIL